VDSWVPEEERTGILGCWIFEKTFFPSSWLLLLWAWAGAFIIY
jgi:hypothetical protein